MLTLIYVELDSSQLQAVCMLDMISVIWKGDVFIYLPIMSNPCWGPLKTF